MLRLSRLVLTDIVDLCIYMYLPFEALIEGISGRATLQYSHYYDYCSNTESSLFQYDGHRFYALQSPEACPFG